MKQVKLLSSGFIYPFEHEKRSFDGLQIKEIKNATIVFYAMKNGIKYTSINKRMQFNDTGNVFIKFGKNQLIIGEYSEVK